MKFSHFGINIGPVTISYFGLILVAGMVAGGYLSYREAKKKGEQADYVLDVMTWALVAGVILSRLFYIFNPPPSAAALHDRRWYLTHPFDLQAGPLAIWSGGLSVTGALVGGVLGAAICLRRRNADLRKWGDILAPGVLIGLSVAGWANIVNQQLYGPPTTLPWGMKVTRLVPPYATAEYLGIRFHPTPAYLSLWALAGFGALLWTKYRYARKLQTGDLFLLALAFYLPGVFLADFLRVDMPAVLFGLTGMQVVAILAMAWTVYRGYLRLGPVGAPHRVRPESPHDEEDGDPSDLNREDDVV